MQVVCGAVLEMGFGQPVGEGLGVGVGVGVQVATMLAARNAA